MLIIQWTIKFTRPTKSSEASNFKHMTDRTFNKKYINCLQFVFIILWHRAGPLFLTNRAKSLFASKEIFLNLHFTLQNGLDRVVLYREPETVFIPQMFVPENGQSWSRHYSDRENCDLDLDLHQIWDRDRSFAIVDLFISKCL